MATEFRTDPVLGQKRISELTTERLRVALANHQTRDSIYATFGKRALDILLAVPLLLLLVPVILFAYAAVVLTYLSAWAETASSFACGSFGPCEEMRTAF